MEAITNSTESFNKLAVVHNKAKELDAKGDVKGTLILSTMYHNGDYVKQSFKKEVKLLRKAVRMGNLQAKFNLALAFATGEGVKQSTDKAMSMMEQLADDGFEDAIDFLYEDECECCNGGCGAGNLVKCGESLDVVMERFNSYIKDGDFKTAFDLATELDEIGNVDGTYAVAIMYHNGQGVTQNFVKEVEYLEKAISLGSKPALYQFAISNILGRGIEQDAERGFTIMNDLADEGYEDAIEMLVA